MPVADEPARTVGDDRASLPSSGQSTGAIDSNRLMGMPTDINARRYYRVAFQRLDDGSATGDQSPTRMRFTLLAMLSNAYSRRCSSLRLRPVIERDCSLPFVGPSRITSIGSEPSWCRDGPVADRSSARCFVGDELVR